MIFTRYPEPGKAKTRLIPVLGPEGAAELQRRMILRTLATARLAARRLDLSVEVHASGGESADFNLWRPWLGSDLAFRAQASGDLGRRMAESFRAAFEHGHRSAILIGTDIPGIDETLIERAFARPCDPQTWRSAPAADGGYYLVRPCGGPHLNPRKPSKKFSIPSSSRSPGEPARCSLEPSNARPQAGLSVAPCGYARRRRPPRRSPHLGTPVSRHPPPTPPPDQTY